MLSSLKKNVVGPEIFLTLNKHGSKTNLDKKFEVKTKRLGSTPFFPSNKAHIDLITTLSLIEVWHWRPKASLSLFNTTLLCF